MKTEVLSKRKCRPCEGGVKPLEQKFIDEYLENIPDWKQQGICITRVFVFSNFVLGLEFVNKIGKIAEDEGHHPDIFLSWGKVVVTLSTHAISGLSENDFILASKIDLLL